ncbi:MAG: BspA family leucine-rich repeat surface protein, partial [Prevotellaceae bacterium]|nr:BspA family leucine-rich repeat surface protein [Prevotellaceae bacterium]
GMGWMFRLCQSLTALDLSNFDTSKVTDMMGMFEGCESLTALDLSNFKTS